MSTEAEKALANFSAELPRVSASSSSPEQKLQDRDGGIVSEIKSYLARLAVAASEKTAQRWSVSISAPQYKPVIAATDLGVVVSLDDIARNVSNFSIHENWIDVLEETHGGAAHPAIYRDEARLYQGLAEFMRMAITNV